MTHYNQAKREREKESFSTSQQVLTKSVEMRGGALHSVFTLPSPMKRMGDTLYGVDKRVRVDPNLIDWCGCFLLGRMWLIPIRK